MTAVLHINTAPTAATTAPHLVDGARRRIATRHPADDSALSIAAARRAESHRPVRARSVLAALGMGLVMGTMAWMQADAAGVPAVDDAKVDVMATVDG